MLHKLELDVTELNMVDGAAHLAIRNHFHEKYKNTSEENNHLKGQSEVLFKSGILKNFVDVLYDQFVRKPDDTVSIVQRDATKKVSNEESIIEINKKHRKLDEREIKDPN